MHFHLPYQVWATQTVHQHRKVQTASAGNSEHWLGGRT
jgi:hypothetical protein